MATSCIPKLLKAAYITPLLRGEDRANVDNYHPFSKLSILAKILESLVNAQLKQFLIEYNILSEFQSGFRTGHSTITAAILVANNIINSLDEIIICWFI